MMRYLNSLGCIKWLDSNNKGRSSTIPPITSRKIQGKAPQINIILHRIMQVNIIQVQSSLTFILTRISLTNVVRCNFTLRTTKTTSIFNHYSSPCSLDSVSDSDPGPDSDPDSFTLMPCSFNHSNTSKCPLRAANLALFWSG